MFILHSEILIYSKSMEEKYKMKKLFMETSEGLFPIPEDLINKYNLKSGRISPFNRYRIVDKNGSFELNSTSSSDINKMPAGEGMNDDEIVEFNDTGEILSQSEIIDLGEGTDSSNY